MKNNSKSKEEYILMWAEKVSLLVIDGFSQSFIKYFEYPWNKVNDSIICLQNRKELNAYVSIEDYNNLREIHSSYFVDAKNAKEVIINYKKIERSFLRFVEKINKINLENYNEKKILVVFKEYEGFLLEVCAWFRATRPEAEIKIREILLKELNRNYKKNELERVLQILTESPKIDILKRENIEWLNIVKKEQVTEKRLIKHAKKYAILFQNIYDYNLVEIFLKRRLKETKINLKKQEKELADFIKRLNKIKKQQKNIIKKCNNPLIRKYSKIFQDFGYYRLQVKTVWAGGEFLCLPMFKRIADLASISVDELLNTYTINDIKNFLTHNRKLSNKKINERKQCVVYCIKNKKIKIIEGNIATKFIKNNIKINKKVEKQLQGTSASSGVYIGRARIVLSSDITNLFIKKGEVLVTDMTQPSMILIMKKAGAIVTNQGGLTSHAAIMSREFKIPSFGHENYLGYALNKYFGEEGIKNCEFINFKFDGDDIVANFRNKDAKISNKF